MHQGHCQKKMKQNSDFFYANFSCNVYTYASNLSSLRKKLSRHATTSWYWCFCPRKGSGGKKPGKIELDLKKKAAKLSSRIKQSWMTSLTVDESEKYFYHMKYLHRFYMSSRYLDFTRTALYHSQFKITVISLILGGFGALANACKSICMYCTSEFAHLSSMCVLRCLSSDWLLLRIKN